MASLIALAAVVAVLAVVVVLLWRKSARLRDAAYEECEVCGKRDRRNVTVSSTPTRHAALGGWSAISATWCREHVPDEHRPAA